MDNSIQNTRLQFLKNNKNEKHNLLSTSRIIIKSSARDATEPCFALKGGTAINFYIRDLPRLSVDLDLAYLPIEPREQTLVHISEALERISLKIQRLLPNTEV